MTVTEAETVTAIATVATESGDKGKDSNSYKDGDKDSDGGSGE